MISRPRTQKAQGEASLAQFEATKETWKNDTIKTLGANYKQDLGIASKALREFGTPELISLLNDSGLGNHKEVINHFIKVGKSISEDSFNEGRKGAGVVDAARTLYPNMK